MVGLLAGLALASAQANDGEDTVRLARLFARKVGVKCDLYLESLGKTDGKAWGFGNGKYWFVGFSRADGGSASVYLSPGGEVVHYQAHPPKRSKGGPDPRTPANERHAKAVLARIPHKGPVVLESLGVGEEVYSATFKLLVHGRRYFNLNPSYGYHMNLDRGTGELTWFGGNVNPPPPNATVAKFPALRAKSIFLEYAKEEKENDGIARLLAPDWPFDQELTVELGYYALKGEAKAKLVWRGVVAQIDSKGKRAPLGSLKMYVDALTGKCIQPTDW